jgi:membrane-bound lytic murein transglycosylase B
MVFAAVTAVILTRRGCIMGNRRFFAVAFLITDALASGAASAAAPCHISGSYESWLAGFERDALAQGISQATIAAAAPSLTYDQRIVNIDRGQHVFTQTSCNSPIAWPPLTAFSAARR